MLAGDVVAFHRSFELAAGAGMIDLFIMMPERSKRLPFFVHRCVRAAQGVLVGAGVRNEAVVVGVSGGGDSMALLEIVGLLAPRLDLQLHVACVDHGLRPEAPAEAELVRRAAARWEAEFHATRLRGEAPDEDSLRRARHAYFEAVRLETGCRFILLGHTRDDQVETIVFRFLRGAGLGGLSAMREARGPLLRPLLALPRAELRRMLVSRNVEWAEDSTNSSDRYARGRLRNGVLPAIEEAFGSGALHHLIDVAPRWNADEDFLELEASRLLAYASRRGPGRIDLDVEALACAHPALRARALRRWLVDSTGRMPGSRDIAAIERWLDGSNGKRGRLDLAGARLSGSGDRLSLEATGSVSLEATGSMSLEAADSMSLEATDSIDITALSGDPTVARGTVGAHEAGIRRKPVLPPSDGRVRFPRK